MNSIAIKCPKCNGIAHVGSLSLRVEINCLYCGKELVYSIPSNKIAIEDLKDMRKIKLEPWTKGGS